MSYTECKKNKINEYLKKFEKGKLLNKKKNPIKNHKQALAISLSVANKECIKNITNDDIIILEKKIDKLFYNKNKLSVSIVKDIIIILKYYKKNKKYKKYKKLRIDLIIRVLNDVINDNVNKYLIKEVLNYIHRESVSY